MSYLWLPYMILPIYAGLERIPNSLISASEDLGARPFTTFRRVILPLAFPAVVAGSIFTFSLTLGDYITPRLVSNDQFIGNVDLLLDHQRPAVRGGAGAGADRGHDRLPRRRPEARRLRARLMRLSRRARALLRVAVGLGLAFIYIPLIVIGIYAFNSSKILKWPPPGLTLDWFSKAFESESRPRSAADLGRGGRRRDRDRDRCSAPWPRSPSPATASSAARRSPSWSSCRSPCRGSSPASPSATPSPRCSASASAC